VTETVPFTTPDRAQIAEPGKLNALLTQLFAPFMGDEAREIQVHPAAFSFEPQGSRLHVVNYPNPSMFGGLHLPPTEGEASGIGVVIAVGRSAFWEKAPHPGAGFFPGKSQEELLYRTVIYGQYAGKSLRLNYRRDSTFYSDILVLTDRDIWAVRWPELGQPYRVENDFLEIPTEGSPL
jgi:hypothetical protein